MFQGCSLSDRPLSTSISNNTASDPARRQELAWHTRISVPADMDMECFKPMNLEGITPVLILLNQHVTMTRITVFTAAANITVFALSFVGLPPLISSCWADLGSLIFLCKVLAKRLNQNFEIMKLEN